MKWKVLFRIQTKRNLSRVFFIYKIYATFLCVENNCGLCDYIFLRILLVVERLCLLLRLALGLLAVQTVEAMGLEQLVGLGGCKSCEDLLGQLVVAYEGKIFFLKKISRKGLLIEWLGYYEKYRIETDLRIDAHKTSWPQRRQRRR